MLFHHSAPGHPPGYIIEPGSWGRSTSLEGPVSPWWSIERLFEEGRVHLRPTAPSRWYATFAYEQLNVAITFLRLRSDGQILYEVEHVDPTAASHRGNLGWLHPDIISLPAEEQRRYASAYWRYEPEAGDLVEVVSASALRIVRALPEDEVPDGGTG